MRTSPRGTGCGAGAAWLQVLPGTGRQGSGEAAGSKGKGCGSTPEGTRGRGIVPIPTLNNKKQKLLKEALVYMMSIKCP